MAIITTTRSLSLVTAVRTAKSSGSTVEKSETSPQMGERERRVNRFRDSSPSTVSSAPPPPPPLPVGMTSGGIINGIWTLNLARPPPTPNQPQLKFVPMDIENLSITKPLEPPPHALGQNNLIEPNQQVVQANYGQGLGAHLGMAWGNQSLINNISPTPHFIDPNYSHFQEQ